MLTREVRIYSAVFKSVLNVLDKTLRKENLSTIVFNGLLVLGEQKPAV